MLRIEGEPAERRDDVAPERAAEGDGLLFLAMLAASWVIAIGVGWVIWRMAPL